MRYTNTDPFRVTLKENITKGESQMSEITLADFANNNEELIWNQACHQHKVESIRRLNRFFKFQDYGKRPIRSFNLMDVDIFTSHLKQKGLSESTCNRYRAAISKIFTTAYKYEKIDRQIKIPLESEKHKSRPNFFSPEQIEQCNEFLSQCKHPYVLHFFHLGLETGMRRGEILSIGEEPDPKGRKPYGVISRDRKKVMLYNTKSKHPREVPLNKFAEAALAALDDRPSKHYSKKTFYNTWKKLRDHVAYGDVNFVFHTTRHTCATLLANEHRVPTAIVSEILGHQSADTTRKYVHVTLKTKSDVMNQLGGISR